MFSTLLSLQNLLVIIQNLLVIIQNLLVVIQNLLLITSKPTRYNSKPTRYHLKTNSLLFKNLVKIHQRFFCDKLANISPPPHCQQTFQFSSQDQRYSIFPRRRGTLEKISTGMLVLFFVSLTFEKLLFFQVAQNDGYF